jgi:hypothetical protein
MIPVFFCWIAILLVLAVYESYLMQTLFKRIVELFKTNCSTNSIDQIFLHKYDTIYVQHVHTCIINIYNNERNHAIIIIFMWMTLELEKQTTSYTLRLHPDLLLMHP